MKTVTHQIGQNYVIFPLTHIYSSFYKFLVIFDNSIFKITLQFFVFKIICLAVICTPPHGAYEAGNLDQESRVL